MPSKKSKEIGRRGEAIACRYLQEHGYSIRARNLQVGWHGEIDILADDRADDCLVFVEVKTRSFADTEFLPEANLDSRKRTAIFSAARRWVALHDYEGGYRIDLISVIGSRVTDHFIEIPPPGRKY